MSSSEADEHLALLARLKKDSEKQLKHINRIREKKGLPPIQRLTPGNEDDQIVIRNMDEKEDQELVANSDLIIGLRVYKRSPDGPVGSKVDGEELCATHREVRRFRECYRDFDGSMVHVGEVTGMRKIDGRVKNGKVVEPKEIERKAPGVLKSIMVRLVPHEAEVVGVKLTRETVASAMDRTVAEFERGTGVEVISAVVHQMSPTDLHIHIQYTLTHQVEESKSMLGRRHRPWRLHAAAMARESLTSDGVLNPAPITIWKRKQEMIQAGILEPEPQAGIEFQKRAGLRDLGDGAILGYSFRQKLNLVRLAEDGGEPEVASAVIKKNDERGRFAPYARKSDEVLDRDFLDLWLERAWRRNVKEELPEELKKGLVTAGVEAAKNYAIFGTTLVEDHHIEIRTKELAIESEKILSAKRVSKAEIQKQADELFVEANRIRAEQAAFERRKAATDEDMALMTVRVAALEKNAGIAKELKRDFKELLESILKIPKVAALLRAMPSVWKRVEKLAGLLDLNIDLGPSK